MAGRDPPYNRGMNLPGMPLSRPTLRANTVLVATGLLLLLFANTRFWQIALSSLPPGQPLQAALFVACLGAVLFVLIMVLVLPLGFGPLLKPWLVVLLLLSAGAAYFMHNYGSVIDRLALQSVAETDVREAGEWLSWRMLWTLLGLWVLPVAALLWVRIEQRPWKRELWSRLKLVLACALLLPLAALLSGKHIASTVRNHSELRYLMNPVSVLSASLSYAHAVRGGHSGPIEPLGRDAHRGGAMAPGGKPLLLVLLVGESARASSFALDGYARDTNPELSKLPIVNFSNVRSCGTDTTVSVPCMFSNLGRADYDEGMAHGRENVLDVLAHAGFDVTWYDNNTGSKDVAIRQREVDLADVFDKRFCTYGCYDETLLNALRGQLPSLDKDSVIVLHTKGSHGPAYYLRYPPAFERFQPVCRTNELQRCTRQEILNAYDNSILYTDHVIAEAIRTLAADTQVDSAVVYVSDHGESTGEKGLYLHGAPYLVAPDDQTHVPMLLWLSDGFRTRRGVDMGCLRAKGGAPLSHDNLFDLLLGLLDVRTGVYRPAQDPIAGCL